MKTALIIGIFSILAFLAFFYVLGIVSRSGNPPGLIGGKLAKCSGSPNCVCSEEQDNHALRIEPVTLPSNSPRDLLSIVKSAIRESGGEIKSEDGNYIASVFTSSVFGFADDFEVRIDSVGNALHIRSASRVGYSDFGVNGRKVDLFKSVFSEKLKEAGE